jgi:NADH:ubiquinone oxidoreductase subunit 6 (subunit J)
MNYNVNYSIPFLFLAVPHIVFAQELTLLGVGAIFLLFFNILTVLVLALALVVFIWGVIQLVGAQDDESKRTSARQRITFGIIALFVMVSVWGLVNVLIKTFGTTQTQAPSGDVEIRETTRSNARLTQ